MRNLHSLDKFRLTDRTIIEYYGNAGDETCGVFEISSPIDGGTLRIIASAGLGWDHVSVSRRNRCPNWPEMEFIKRAFFRPDEVCMQLHVGESDHISIHPNCLHIWRPHDQKIPLPPKDMVA